VKRHGKVRLLEPGSLGEDQSSRAWSIAATPDVMIRLKRIFPRANARRSGAITLGDTPDVARDIEWVLERWPMQVKAEHRERLLERARQHRRTEEAVEAILSGDAPHLDYVAELARPARDYQLVAADLALTTGRLLLTDDLGLGKTMSGLLLLRDPRALPALVVCPTHLPQQWADELALTLPFLRPHIVRTLEPYDPARHRSMHGHDPDVLIMPYSKLRGWGDALAGRVRTVIFDEAQELRRTDSAKYTAAATVADGAQFRVGLTATPIYNYGGEIYNVMSVIAPDALGGKQEFGREWCANEGWSDKASVADPAALGTHLREQGLMLRRTSKEVRRELPGDFQRVPHPVETDREVLDRLSGDASALAELIVSRRGHPRDLFQASGDLDWKMRHATGVAKAPYVAEFVKLLLESEEKIVLFGWHRAVYEIWQKRLMDYDPVLYTGSENALQKQRSRGAFVSGDSRVLMMSLRSGAGLDGLQHVCRVAVFGELDWSPGMHDQCIGRLYRDGQEESVLAYFLLSDQGADPVMAEVLNLKRMQSEPLRDPDAPIVEQQQVDEHRVRRLAEDLLRRRGRAVPQPVQHREAKCVNPSCPAVETPVALPGEAGSVNLCRSCGRVMVRA